MQVIKGKYNEAKVFTSVMEEGAAEQIKAMCDFAPFAGCKIRIMPDVHAGAGCTIGTTMTITDKVVPNMVGVDIGCGMELVALKEKNIDYAALDKLIYDKIPSGMRYRENPHEYARSTALEELKCYKKINADLAMNSVGTLGGGNHFIEVDGDDEGNKYLVIHSGSRHLGLEVANYYQKEAYRRLAGNSGSQIQELIARLKAEGRQREIEGAVKRAKESVPDIHPDMAYAEGDLFLDYIHDMKIVQHYAVLNRKAMADEIVKGMGFTVTDGFTTIHNYIDTESMILRKGAVSAKKGERLLIPINMRDGSLVCTGKGNEDWNCSAPHGAGRLMSRGKAASTLTLEEFEKQMEGIYSSSVNKNTLDESPMAYKNLEDIVGNIATTAQITKRILPVYNFKASEDASAYRKKKA